MDVVVTGPRDRGTVPPNAVLLDTTSKGENTWARGFSPFFLGPVKLYGDHTARRMENAWQFAKCYPDQVDAQGKPTAAYWQWAKNGWDLTRAVRYPRGKGAKPAYCYWDGEMLGYVDARLRVYWPLYREAVRQTEAFHQLLRLARTKPIVLWDFDGYDHEQQGLSLADVLQNEKRPMGHAFVIKAMLLYGPDVTPEVVFRECAKSVPPPQLSLL